MADIFEIAGRIHSTSQEEVVTVADEILDSNKNKKQSNINAEVDATLAEHTSTIQGLNSQNYETYTATDQTTAETDVLPAEGSEDTIYRLGNWDGSQYDVTCYSEYSWNGSAYVHISTKTQIGEVFDISAYHATGGELAKYADLAAALGTNGANIPDALRKGGMSVKYVSSSDNNYVQYRLMSDTFNTTPANWQGIDDEPTVGSDNLVKSGGITEVYGFYTNNSVYLAVWCDKNKHIFVGLQKDGNVFFGAGVPRQIIEYVREQIELIKKGTDTTTIDGINKITAFLDGFVTSDTLVGYLNKTYGEYVDNNTFMVLELDKKKRILGGRYVNGNRFENAPFEFKEITGDLATVNELNVIDSLNLSDEAKDKFIDSIFPKENHLYIAPLYTHNYGSHVSDISYGRDTVVVTTSSTSASVDKIGVKKNSHDFTFEFNLQDLKNRYSTETQTDLKFCVVVGNDVYSIEKGSIGGKMVYKINGESAAPHQKYLYTSTIKVVETSNPANTKLYIAGNKILNTDHAIDAIYFKVHGYIGKSDTYKIQNIKSSFQYYLNTPKSGVDFHNFIGGVTGYARKGKYLVTSYYNESGNGTCVLIDLETGDVTTKVFETGSTTYDTHNIWFTAIDKDGGLHIMGNCHNSALHYYYCSDFTDISNLEAVDYLEISDCTYPLLFNAGEELFVMYRYDGGSTSSKRGLKKWDGTNLEWDDVFMPIIDGKTDGGDGEGGGPYISRPYYYKGEYYFLWSWETAVANKPKQYNVIKTSDFETFKDISNNPVAIPIVYDTDASYIIDDDIAVESNTSINGYSGMCILNDKLYAYYRKVLAGKEYSNFFLNDLNGHVVNITHMTNIKNMQGWCIIPVIRADNELLEASVVDFWNNRADTYHLNDNMEEIEKIDYVYPVSTTYDRYQIEPYEDVIAIKLQDQSMHADSFAQVKAGNIIIQ